MNKEQFLKGLSMFLMTFSELDFDQTKIDFYFDMLKDIDNINFEKAIMSICREKTTWFPNDNFIAAVRSYAVEDKGDTIILAWEKVLKGIQAVGQYYSPKFDDPVIHSTIELMGGWIKLCTCQEDELKWKLKDFKDIYTTMSKKDIHPDRLIGTHEINNNARGFETNEVKQIGGKGGKTVNQITKKDIIENSTINVNNLK